MPEWVLTVVASFLGGGACVALIGLAKDKWLFKAQRKATKEDREEAKKDKVEEIGKNLEELKKSVDESDARMKEVAEKQQVVAEALKVILLDRILHLGQSYIAKGEITFDDRKRFHAMHDIYHSGLDGNGDADLIVEGVDELPLKK